MKPVNRPWVHSLNGGAPLCVGDILLVVLSYTFQLFSLTEVCLRVWVALYFVYFVHGWVVCGYFTNCFSCALVSSYRPTNCVLPLIFSWTCTCTWFFFSKLFYYIFQLFHFPCYQITINAISILFALWSSHLHYICTFHYPILDGILR